MNTMTLNELAQKTGIVGPRLVEYWRAERPIPRGECEGMTIQNEKRDGGRVWWLEVEPEPKGEFEAVDPKVYTPSPGLDEDESSPESEITLVWLKGIDGIGDKAAQGVVGGCRELGITTFSGLAGVEDLTKFDGVGKKNGAALREALTAKKSTATLQVDVDEKGRMIVPDDVAPVPEKPSQPPPEASKLREFKTKVTDEILSREKDNALAKIAVDELAEMPPADLADRGVADLATELLDHAYAQKTVQACDVCGEEGKICKITGVMCLTCKKDITRIQTAYPIFVYSLAPADIDLAKRAVDMARHPKQIPCVDGMSDRCREEFLAWHRDTADERKVIPKKECPPILVDIRCPHCDELFDRAPAGEYLSGEAKCEPPCEDPERPGCGKLFWLEATKEGYVASTMEEVLPEFPAPEDVVTPELVGPEIPAIPVDPFEDTDAGEEEDPFAALLSEPQDTPEESGVVFEAPHKARLPSEDRIHPALTDCTVLAKTETHSDDWHAARSKGVGSSDAGAILGLSPHAEPVDVWKTKIGEDTPRKPWLDDYSEFGTWFEPYIREWSMERSGTEIIDGAGLGTLQSIHWPHALANIDGLDLMTGAVEEYKTTSDKWVTIPAHYEAQVQHQMFVTGVHEVRLIQFVCPVDRTLIPSLLSSMRALAIIDSDADRALANWLIEHGEFTTWIVERDEKYLERLITQEKRFWGYVEAGIVPPAQDPEGTVDLSDEAEVLAACEEYARLNAPVVAAKPHAKAADKAKKKAKEAIDRAIALLGEKPKRLVIGSHKATWVQKEAYGYWNIYAGEAEDPFAALVSSGSGDEEVAA